MDGMGIRLILHLKEAYSKLPEPDDDEAGGVAGGTKNIIHVRFMRPGCLGYIGKYSQKKTNMDTPNRRCILNAIILGIYLRFRGSTTQVMKSGSRHVPTRIQLKVSRCLFAAQVSQKHWTPKVHYGMPKQWMFDQEVYLATMLAFLSFSTSSFLNWVILRVRSFEIDRVRSLQFYFRDYAKPL